VLQPKIGDIVRVQGIVEDTGVFGRVAIRFMNHKRLAWLEADMVKEIIWTPKVGTYCNLLAQDGKFRVIAFDAPYAIVRREGASRPVVVLTSELRACAA
jgi:hypothetical protein